MSSGNQSDHVLARGFSHFLRDPQFCTRDCSGEIRLEAHGPTLDGYFKSCKMVISTYHLRIQDILRLAIHLSLQEQLQPVISGSEKRLPMATPWVCHNFLIRIGLLVSSIIGQTQMCFPQLLPNAIQESLRRGHLGRSESGFWGPAPQRTSNNEKVSNPKLDSRSP